MKLSIIIVNYKSFSDLDCCLKTLSENKPSYEYEIIVVDNNSKQPDQEKDFLHKWGHTPNFTYLQAPSNLGFGRGNNFGAARARGEYLLIMNPDIEVWEGSLDEAMYFLDAHKEAGILGGQLRYPNGVIQDSYRNFPTLPDQFIKRLGFLRKHQALRKRVSRYLMWDKDPSITEPVDWVVGGFLFIRKKAFDEIGGFDDRYFLFMEDVDFCRQMWSKGWQVVYHSRVVATHREERLSAGGISDFFRKKTLRVHVLSAIKYFWKYRFQTPPRQKR